MRCEANTYSDVCHIRRRCAMKQAIQRWCDTLSNSSASGRVGALQAIHFRAFQAIRGASVRFRQFVSGRFAAIQGASRRFRARCGVPARRGRWSLTASRTTLGRRPHRR
eukprot:3268930-Prymnesium_polylepis.2